MFATNQSRSVDCFAATPPRHVDLYVESLVLLIPYSYFQLVAHALDLIFQLNLAAIGCIDSTELDARPQFFGQISQKHVQGRNTNSDGSVWYQSVISGRLE